MLDNWIAWAVGLGPNGGVLQAPFRSLIVNLLIPLMLGVLLFLVASPLEKWIIRLAGRAN
jgi:hypothetical protein